LRISVSIRPYGGDGTCSCDKGIVTWDPAVIPNTVDFSMGIFQILGIVLASPFSIAEIEEVVIVKDYPASIMSATSGCWGGDN
jgi:hypothetical protein